ncbi:MAG: SGNH/GDSL hydrolase family protein, partial [Thermoguttaceae bacterium]
MKKLLTTFFFLFLTVCAQAMPEYVQQDSFDCHPRTGIGNTIAKLKAGETVTVAYFGGSITAQNGWRPKTSKFLGETFPNATINEIHAAIGGTGSDLGVFRLGYDVLRHDPDLVFVEFATNDGGNNPVNIWKQMEGIVRQIWKHNPKTDIVFVYTVTTATVGDYQSGKLARAAEAMEMLADFYGIPTINFGKRVAQMVDDGKLIMKGDEAPEGVILFAKDGVHPGDEGHELYLADIKAGFEKMKDLPGIDHAPLLEKVFIEGNYENAKMVSITP